MKSAKFFALGILLFTFSCGTKEDDNPKPSTKSKTDFTKLEGKWIFKSQTFYAKDSNHNTVFGGHSHYNNEPALFVEFKPNGVITEATDGTFDLQGNYLNISINEDDAWHLKNGNYYIDSLTANFISFTDTTYSSTHASASYEIQNFKLFR